MGQKLHEFTNINSHVYWFGIWVL